jgi:hypothetical protein
MLTLLHLTTENTEELEFLRERIEAELARRELAQRQENRSSAVVEGGGGKVTPERDTPSGAG